MQQQSKNILKKKEKENLKDKLPKKAAHMRNVYAYLGKTRQIDGSVINEFVKRQMLYQDDRNNCVFVSRNKEGEPVFACMRRHKHIQAFCGRCERQ